MDSYPRSQSSIPEYSHNPNSMSQQSQATPESATSRFKRAFGRRRTIRAGEFEDGTQSDAPTSRRMVPASGISSLIAKKDPKPALQFASSTFQALGHRLNKQPVPRVTSQMGPPPDFVVAKVQEAMEEQRSKQPSPTQAVTVPNRKSIHRTSQLVSGPEISAAIEYMLESPRNSTSTPASSPKPKAVPEQMLSPPSPRALRSGSVGNDAAPQPRPRRENVDAGKRRSMSLTFIPTFAASNSSPPQVQPISVEKDAPPSSFNLSPKFAPSSFGPHNRSQSAVQPPIPTFISSSSLSEAKPSTESNAAGFIHPSNSDRSSPAANIRGKLAAWNTSSSQTDAEANVREPRSSRGSSPNHSKAASMVASIGPAAMAATGIAASFSKRAYEKVNSMWTPAANRASHSSPHSTQSSESSDPNTSRVSHAPHPSKARLNYSNYSGYGGSMSDAETTRRRMGVHGHANVYGRKEEQPVGPSLGVMLRPPFRRVAQGGGLVFGRPLADCVRDTKPLVVLGSHDDGIEARYIPALVLRCVQHIERWGLSEEGLFRISGRTSHINKIRMEFASGADYDLQVCGPGDLDPHAVASVLKAFLRELPDPILTRMRSALFEAAFERAKENGFMFAMPSPTSPPASSTPPAFVTRHGAGLPSNPRVGLPSGPRDGLSPPPPPMQPMHSPQDFLHLQSTPSSQQTQDQSPNQNDGTYPNDAAITPHEALSNLLSEFHTLAGSLPRENRDLLLTIVELLKRAAGQSKTTKMPLSNLLLVLCPSMSMNPGVLKVFVEHADTIFMEKELPEPAPSPTAPTAPMTAASYQFSVTDDNSARADAYTTPAAVAPTPIDAEYGEQHASSTRPSVEDEGQLSEREMDQSQSPVEPLPADRLPVRKQSLKRLQQVRMAPVTGDSAPSAYTTANIQQNDVYQEARDEIARPQEPIEPPRYATQLQDSIQRQDGLHRSNSSSRSASPSAPYESTRPAGPRLIRTIPAPLTLHGRQASTSSSQIQTPQQAEHTRTPPVTANGFSPRITVFPAPGEILVEVSSSPALQSEAPRSFDSAPPSGEGDTLLVTPSLPEVDNLEPLTSTFVDRRMTHLVQRRTIFASDITPPPSTGSTTTNMSPPPATGTSIGTAATHGSSLGVPTPDTGRTMVSQPLTPLLMELQKQNAGDGDEEGQRLEEGRSDYPKVEPLSLQKKAASTTSPDMLVSTMNSNSVVDSSSRHIASSEATLTDVSQPGLHLDKPIGIYSESSLSSASSAVTDGTNLFDREMSWPEVPTTIPTFKAGANGLTMPSFTTPASSTPLPINMAQTNFGMQGQAGTDSSVTGSRRPLPQPPQVNAALPAGGHFPTQLPPANPSPMGNNLININVSKEPTSASSDSADEHEEDDSLSNLTMRQNVNVRAPRLTVNSKDMINGDSFWAKELQRALRSASPTSPVEREQGHDATRYSGEWATSVLNASGT